MIIEWNRKDYSKDFIKIVSVDMENYIDVFCELENIE